MHIEISYLDGTTELLPVDLEGEFVMQGRSMIPGHEVLRPQRCYFQEDYFQASLDEGQLREGAVEALEGDDFESFTWKLVGTEEEVCRDKLQRWTARLGHDFDPLGDAPGDLTDADLQDAWRRDQQCWMQWLDDPAAELQARPSFSPSPTI